MPNFFPGERVTIKAAHGNFGGGEYNQGGIKVIQ